MKTYSRFIATLSGMEGETAPGTDFLSICRMLHVSPNSLEEILYGELGMSGDEVVEMYLNN